MATDALDPLRLLQEDLKDDDYEQAITSIKRLPTIAHALGAARTRDELLPFLHEFSETDMDEGQTAVAAQLGDFTELVGGASHAACLLPLLEKLAGAEECVVRNAAVGSLVKLAPKLPKPDVAGKFVPLIRRLANGDWFTTRVSACGLLTASYPLVNETLQAELRELSNNLCNDDTPMVRKAAYQQLGSFACVVEKQYFKSDILNIVKQISQDDMDLMRIFTIDCCATIASHVDPMDFQISVLPIIEGLQDDASWRVRKALAEKTPSLCESLGEVTARKRLLPLFAKLLKDKEAEVRASACSVMGEVGRHCRGGVEEFIVPCLEALANDQVPNVRVALSKSIMGMTEPLGKDAASTILLPLIQQLTKDENHEVKNNVIDQLDVLAEAVGPSGGLVTSLVPALVELSKDNKWRVRQAIINKSSMLAKHLGPKVFEKKLQHVVVLSLSDHVFSIRENCCEQMGLIVAQYGGKWAAEKFFHPAFAIYDKTANYLHRMTCLLLITHVAPHCASDVVEKHLLPLVMNACTDDVANVRIAASKTMMDVIPKLETSQAKSATIKPALELLVDDEDQDVRYFAGLALALCQ